MRVSEKRKVTKRQREDERTRRDRETITKGVKKEQNREHWAPEAQGPEKTKWPHKASVCCLFSSSGYSLVCPSLPS